MIAIEMESDQGLVVAEHIPEPLTTRVIALEDAVLPGGQGAGIDPALLDSILSSLTSLDSRLDVVESVSTSQPSGPAGGDLAGTYPNPTLARAYALQSALDTAIGGRAPRVTTRTVSANTTAAVAELIQVNAATAPVTVTPPANPQPGEMVSVYKIDTSPNSVFWGGATHSDANAEIVGRWNGATFFYAGSGLWLIHSVNVSYSDAPQAGGTIGGLTREQADALYEHAGAIQNAFANLNKNDFGLGNVDNTHDLDKPISYAVQQALDSLSAKAPTTYSFTASGQVTLNAATALRQAITAVGNIVLQPPINPTDMDAIRIEVYASGSSRTLNVSSSVNNSAQTLLPITIPAGRIAILVLTWSDRSSRWTMWQCSPES